MKERDVKAMLLARVKQLRGEARKVTWSGRRGAPDWRVMVKYNLAWVELKKPGEPLTAQQAAEHQRMRNNGERVLVIDGPEAIDKWFPL